MFVRLRHGGKAGVVALLVALALGGSALLAYGFTAPGSGVYPVLGRKVQGHVTVGGHGAAGTRVTVEAIRTSTGTVKGAVVVMEPKTDRHGRVNVFHATTINSLTTSGTTAEIIATGTRNGQSGYVADITVNTANPESVAVTIKNGSTVVFSVAGPVTQGSIRIR